MNRPKSVLAEAADTGESRDPDLVTFAVDSKTGAISIDKDPIIVEPDANLSFKCSTGAFSVMFYNGSPVAAKSRFKGAKGQEDGGTVAKVPGRYKYVVSATGDDGIPYSRDPEVVIKPGSGGGSLMDV